MFFVRRQAVLLAGLFEILSHFQSDAFGINHASLRARSLTSTSAPLLRTDTRIFDGADKESSEKGPMDFVFNPYDSKIPKEIEQEIYAAEANTPAAQDRNKRVSTYALLAFIGIFMAFFNGFLSELRTSTTPDGELFSMSFAGFGWVEGNFLTKFLFMNKIGGGIALIGGCGMGLMAEAELDTQRKNAEKIFEEMQRRRKEKSGPKKRKGPPKQKKRRSGKEKKRLNAMAEVAASETSNETSATDISDNPDEKTSDEKPEEPTTKEGGVMGAFKDFYDKADKMAASQALLLNKELEERGVVDKITDESGLKVIGKDAAAKIEQERKEKSGE